MNKQNTKIFVSVRRKIYFLTRVFCLFKLLSSQRVWSLGLVHENMNLIGYLEALHTSQMQVFNLLFEFLQIDLIITLHFTLHDLSENELQAGNFSCFFTNAYIIFPSAIRNCFLFPAGPGLGVSIKQKQIIQNSTHTAKLISYCQPPGQIKVNSRLTSGLL